MEKKYIGRVYGDERGEYRICSIKSTVVMERDCGDHLEVTPIVIARPDNPKFIFLQRPTSNSLTAFCVADSALSPIFSIPSITLKIPKHLPQNTTESIKVLSQIEREAQLTAIYHILQADTQTVITAEDVITFLQSLKSEEENVNKLP